MSRYEKKFPDWKDRVIKAANSCDTATAAAALLGIKFSTYKKYAELYNCYKTNQSGKGKSKASGTKIPLWDILEGLHPQYQSNKLRIRLLEEKVFEHECASCKLTTWLDQPIPLELEHKDGDHTNHLVANLELLCPNCHALTETYRGKNKGLKCADIT